MLYEKLPLWKSDEYKGADENQTPTITVFSLKGRKTRPAVIIFPGGGYDHLAPGEGETVAMQFLSRGIQAFIVHYSVAPNTHPQPLMDASRAVCMVRDNCEKWRVDPNQIAVIGFSAGGHLATSLCTNYMDSYLQTIPGMAKDKNRPNLLICCYGVITAGKYAHKGSFNALFGGDEKRYGELSLEKNVHDNMPPAFLWHTYSDGGVPVQNTMLLSWAMAEHNIEHELHIYPKGGHGLSTATGETQIETEELSHIHSWVNLCMDWLKIHFTIPEYVDSDYRGGAVYDFE